MDKKNIDWGNLGFGYMQTDKRYVSTWKDGAWDEGGLVDDANITMNECACVLQYAQTAFEGLKAYTTEDGKIVHAPERIEIGRVTMNFPELIKTAEKTGVKYFVVEDEVYSTGNPLESVKMSADYIKAHLLEK